MPDPSPAEAVIVSTARTAIGTAGRGSLVDVDPFDLATWVVADALRRSGLAAGDVDDVVLGESLQGGGAIARYAAIEAGIVEAPGLAHNRHCASGLAAVQTAAASVMAGMGRVVVAGGVHSSWRAPADREAAVAAPSSRSDGDPNGARLGGCW